MRFEGPALSDDGRCRVKEAEVESKIDKLLAVPEVPTHDGDGRRNNGPSRARAKPDVQGIGRGGQASGIITSVRRRRIAAKQKREEPR